MKKTFDFEKVAKDFYDKYKIVHDGKSYMPLDLFTLALYDYHEKNVSESDRKVNEIIEGLEKRVKGLENHKSDFWIGAYNGYNSSLHFIKEKLGMIDPYPPAEPVDFVEQGGFNDSQKQNTH
jgi:hypothetical protein